MTETTGVFSIILTDMWDDEVKRTVGEITIAFAQLEHALWVLPKRIKELNIREWADIAGTVSIPARCQQIRDAFAQKHMNQELEAQLESLLGAVERVNEFRNSI